MSIKIENYSDKSFVVRGETTIKFKDTLKEFGGKWNSSLKNGGAWIFSNIHRERVEKLMEAINMKKAVSEKVESSKVEKVESPKIDIETEIDDDSIEINDYTEKSFYVKGNTKDYKEQLKNLGGKWNGFKKFWIFPINKREEVEKIFSEY